MKQKRHRYGSLAPATVEACKILGWKLLRGKLRSRAPIACWDLPKSQCDRAFDALRNAAKQTEDFCASDYVLMEEQWPVWVFKSTYTGFGLRISKTGDRVRLQIGPKEFTIKRIKP